MAIRRIRKEGDPVLRTVCKPVTQFDESLWRLLDDMQETLKDAGGVGLAAPQVGIPKRIRRFNQLLFIFQPFFHPSIRLLFIIRICFRIF